MIILLAFLAACSSDNNTQDVPDMSSVNDTSTEKDIVVNDLNDADDTLNVSDQRTSKVCEALPPEFIFEPDTNLEELLGCEVSLSPIQVVEYPGTKITGLDSLREMGPIASLIIRRTPNLVDVNTFANLTLVKNDMQIVDAPILTDLSGFRSLRRVEKGLNLEFIPIKNFNGLQDLEYVGELIVDADQLESLEELKNLTEINGDLSLFAPKISETQFREFLKGKTIAGNVYFQDRPFTP